MTIPSMTFKNSGEICEPLKVFEINNSYILAVYQGTFSEFDLLVKYRQKDDSYKSGWSRIRTPKHIHWVVDAMIKMALERESTNKLIEFLLNYWNRTVQPLKNREEQSNLLNDNLLEQVNEEANQYQELADKGEYSVKFLLLITKLLMHQEKTNKPDAYMFKQLLEALQNGKDIFKIVSIATHH